MTEYNLKLSCGYWFIGIIIFAVFLTLKLAEIGVVATWSYIWITAPLWISAALTGVLIIVFLCVFIIFSLKS